MISYKSTVWVGGIKGCETEVILFLEAHALRTNLFKTNYCPKIR